MGVRSFSDARSVALLKAKACRNIDLAEAAARSRQDGDVETSDTLQQWAQLGLSDLLHAITRLSESDADALEPLISKLEKQLIENRPQPSRPTPRRGGR